MVFSSHHLKNYSLVVIFQQLGRLNSIFSEAECGTVFLNIPFFLTAQITEILCIESIIKVPHIVPASSILHPLQAL